MNDTNETTFDEMGPVDYLTAESPARRAEPAQGAAQSPVSAADPA